MKSESESYKASGVDITAGYKAVELMKGHIARTRLPGMGDIGGFGGSFELNLEGIQKPVLVSGTDGVGTKLKIAFLMDRHNTVGIDCVAMCVNDVICCGAKPLFFLDYIALGKNRPEKVASIVEGIAEGCVQSACALVGGETAEMPGFYPEDEYDLAGFCTGLADKDKMIHQGLVEAGDALIALPSSGVHSNGFSLVRKVFDIGSKSLNRYEAELGQPLGDCLLTPTRIYVKPVLALIDKLPVHGLAHITGGGFYENIPRMLRPGLCAVIEQKSLVIPPVFSLMQSIGQIPEHDMFNTFNMGVGMVLAVPQDKADEALRLLRASGIPDAYLLGEIKEGGDGVKLC